jgi:hypothetical protein
MTGRRLAPDEIVIPSDLVHWKFCEDINEYGLEDEQGQTVTQIKQEFSYISWIERPKPSAVDRLVEVCHNLLNNMRPNIGVHGTEYVGCVLVSDLSTALAAVEKAGQDE